MSISEKFKRAYNGHFFPEGKTGHAASATITLTITLNGQPFTLSELEVTPQTRIHDIATWYAGLQHTDEQPAQESLTEKTAPAKPNRNRLDLLGIRHLDYRNTEYMIQHLMEDGKELFVIQNLKTANFIGQDTVTGRSIIKAYRAANFMDEEE